MADANQDSIQVVFQDAEAAVDAADSLSALEEVRILFLGRKGRIADLMKELKSLDEQERKARGKLLNDRKRILSSKFDDKKLALEQATGVDETGEDVTLPGTQFRRGRRHVLLRVMDEIVGVFNQMGFDVVEGPEIEDVFHNFEALNIPKSHIARSPEENFFITDDYLLRSQTSPMQIRIMEQSQPPIRVVVPGRVYRPDTVDATHHFMFHQLEGLMVDKGINFADLISCLTLWAQRMFGEHTKVRFRPHYFPFTEPSAEMDVSCPFCKKGNGSCSVCGSTGWLEIMGCGMVHPNVFRAVGYDPEVYSGFAFGMGPGRIAMLRYGIRDLRHFIENNISFLEQF